MNLFLLIINEGVVFLRPATLLKKRLLAQVFPCEVLRTPFLRNTSERLLLLYRLLLVLQIN